MSQLPMTDKMAVRAKMARHDHRALQYGVCGFAVFIEMAVAVAVMSIVVVEPELRFDTMGIWYALIAQVILAPLTVVVVLGVLALGRRIGLGIKTRAVIATIPVILIAVGIVTWHLGRITPTQRFVEFTGVAPPPSTQNIDYRVDHHSFDRFAHTLTADMSPSDIDALRTELEMRPQSIFHEFRKRAAIGTESYVTRFEGYGLWLEVASGRKAIRLTWSNVEDAGVEAAD